MTGYGGVLRYKPGDDLPVEVVADPSGYVAEKGDPVELVGENAGYTLVQALQSAGNFVGQLTDKPDEKNDLGDAPAPGTNAGVSNLVVGHIIALAYPAADVDPTNDAAVSPLEVDDLVQFGPDGVIRYDSATATAEPDGRVFRTLFSDKATAGKIHVIRSGM